MLISHIWLKDWIDHPLSPEDLAEKLTFLGLETNITGDTRGKFEKIVVGKVEQCGKHPDADKLNTTMVNIGATIVEIVCGASNIAKGQTVAVATVGAVMPNGMKIEKRKLRGQISEGMICSESELGISNESAGIMVLDDSLTAGTPITKALEIEDVILEIDLTPNRGDCLSLLGIAREVSAITGIGIKTDSAIKQENSGIDGLKVEVKNNDSCLRYSAREINGITVAPSPLRIRRRLNAVGIRPVNNIVDITNYLMLETGHPMHAFDKRDIEGGSIVIRNAGMGEKFKSLDEKEHKLTDGDLVIADAKKAIALAGIMGGLNSEITDDTKDVILEAACFNAVSTRKTSRKLSLSTESSFRFERGVNQETVALASIKAASLMAELSGGKLGGFIDIYPEEKEIKKISLRSAKLSKTLGLNVEDKTVSGVLEALGFVFTTGNGEFIVDSLPYRHDITEEADLVEEVARVIGYENIKPTTPRLAQHEASGSGKSYYKRREISGLLAAGGLSEVINYSFINPKWREDFGLDEKKPAQLENPINADQSELRISLLPGLMQNASFNIRHGEEQVSTFETGSVYSIDHDNEMVEEFLTAGVMTGGKEELFGADIPRDFYRLKGILGNMVKKATGTEPEFIKPAVKKRFLYTHRQLEITVLGETIGFMGQVHTLSKEPFEITGDIYCFELSVSSLIESASGKTVVKPIPKFPGIKRDLALIVDERAEVGDIVKTILGSDKAIIRSCRVFDLYHGKQLTDGKKSIAFRLYFQDDEKTLTDETGDEVIKRILDNVEKSHNAKLRN